MHFQGGCECIFRILGNEEICIFVTATDALPYDSRVLSQQFVPISPTNLHSPSGAIITLRINADSIVSDNSCPITDSSSIVFLQQLSVPTIPLNALPCQPSPTVITPGSIFPLRIPHICAFIDAGISFPLIPLHKKTVLNRR